MSSQAITQIGFLKAYFLFLVLAGTLGQSEYLRCLSSFNQLLLEAEEDPRNVIPCFSRAVAPSRAGAGGAHPGCELCSQIVGAGMKAQTQDSCAPPPTCFLCLDKNPKTTENPQRKPGRCQGQHLQRSSPASMSRGFPGPCGQWRGREAAKATG